MRFNKKPCINTQLSIVTRIEKLQKTRFVAFAVCDILTRVASMKKYLFFLITIFIFALPLFVSADDCTQKQSERERDICFRKLAKDTGDDTFCLNVSSQGARDYCYLNNSDTS